MVVAIINLRFTIEYALTNVNNLTLGKVLLRLVHCQTDEVAMCEASLKVAATTGADLLSSHGFLLGERPEARRDGTLISL